MDFFDHPFFRNLAPVAFNQQIEITKNIICEECEQAMFTDVESNTICDNCIEKLIEDI